MSGDASGGRLEGIGDGTYVGAHEITPQSVTEQPEYVAISPKFADTHQPPSEPRFWLKEVAP